MSSHPLSREPHRAALSCGSESCPVLGACSRLFLPPPPLLLLPGRGCPPSAHSLGPTQARAHPRGPSSPRAGTVAVTCAGLVVGRELDPAGPPCHSAPLLFALPWPWLARWEGSAVAVGSPLRSEPGLSPPPCQSALAREVTETVTTLPVLRRARQPRAVQEAEAGGSRFGAQAGSRAV